MMAWPKPESCGERNSIGRLRVVAPMTFSSHASGTPRYLSIFTFTSTDAPVANVQAEPVALLWIIPLCLFLGTWVPAIFFAGHLFLDYSVRYEKMPFYPYSKWVTRGWLTGPSDKLKEACVFTLALCLTVLLFIRR